MLSLTARALRLIPMSWIVVATMGSALLGGGLLGAWTMEEYRAHQDPPPAETTQNLYLLDQNDLAAESEATQYYEAEEQEPAQEEQAQEAPVLNPAHTRFSERNLMIPGCRFNCRPYEMPEE